MVHYARGCSCTCVAVVDRDKLHAQLLNPSMVYMCWVMYVHVLYKYSETCLCTISMPCMQAGYTPIMLIAAHGVEISNNMEAMNHLIARSNVNIRSEQVGSCLMLIHYTVFVLCTMSMSMAHILFSVSGF